MKRYDPVERYAMGGEGVGAMEESVDGDYVKFSDVDALVKNMLHIDGNTNPIISACCGCYKKSDGAGGMYCADMLWDHRGVKSPNIGRHLNKRCGSRFEIEAA